MNKKYILETIGKIMGQYAEICKNIWNSYIDELQPLSDESVIIYGSLFLTALDEFLEFINKTCEKTKKDSGKNYMPPEIQDAYLSAIQLLNNKKIKDLIEHLIALRAASALDKKNEEENHDN